MLDKRTVSKKIGNLISKHTVFEIEHYGQTDYPDIITHPCLMVSKKVKNTIELYDKTIQFERINLQDRKIKKTYIYYIPRLLKLDVLTEKVELTRDKTTIIAAEIHLYKTEQKPLFETGIDEFVTCLLIHRTLAESLLRRGVYGIGLTEVKSKKEVQTNESTT